MTCNAIKMLPGMCTPLALGWTGEGWSRMRVQRSMYRRRS